MAGTVDKVAVGFFDPATGRLRSDSEIQALDKKNQSTQNSSSSGASSDSVDAVSRITNAIGEVRSRTNAQVSGLVTDINGQIDNVKAAQSIVKDELAAAKDLKQLYKQGGSQNDIDAKKAELADIQAKRDELAKKIQSDNQDIGERRIQAIRVGNETKGTFSVSDVAFSAGDSSDIGSASDAQALIDELQQTSSDLKDQKQALKDTKSAVQDTAKEARAEINAAQKDALSSYSEAQSLADKISGVVSSGAQAVYEAHSLNEVAVRALTQG